MRTTTSSRRLAHISLAITVLLAEWPISLRPVAAEPIAGYAPPAHVVTSSMPASSVDWPAAAPSDPARFTSENQYQITHDLAVNGPRQLNIYGAGNLDRSGEHLASCDMDGDGKAEALIGVPLGDGPTDSAVSSGEVHVVAGREPITGNVMLATQATLSLYGAEADDRAGQSVACADVNADGFADVIVGAYTADGAANARPDSGEVYVVFGHAALSGTVSLPAGANWVIYGANSGDQAGYSLAADDVNGDGLADVVIGANLGDGPSEGRLNGGEVYVILGQTTVSRTLDLATEADAVLYGPQAGDEAGIGLTTGDINHDGRADVLIGAFHADGPGDTRNLGGEVYMVLGRAPFNGSYDLATQANWTIYGASAEDYLGTALATGDVNGDGYADLLLGTIYGDGPGETRLNAGEVYLIMGRSQVALTIDLANQSDVTLYGAEASDHAGKAVWAGDVTGDGLADMVVGAEDADGVSNARLSSGETYVLVGERVLSPTWDLASGAYLTIYGAEANDKAGGGLSGGDFDGDGLPEVLLGAWQGDGLNNTTNLSGDTYMLAVPHADVRLTTTPIAAPEAIAAGNGTRARFEIQNLGTVTASVDSLYLNARLGTESFQFPSVGSITLTPGAVYTYSEVRMLYKTGLYTGTAGFGAAPWQPLPVTFDVTHTTFFTTEALSYTLPAQANGHAFWCGQAGEPVNTATGNFYSIQTDLRVPGPGAALEIIRTYNSRDAAQDGAFGYGWAFNDDIFLSEAVDGVVVARFEDGKRGAFSPIGDGTYTAMDSLFDTLVKTTLGYTLTRANQMVYAFDTEGRLNRLIDPDGLALDLTHVAGRLTAITDTAGLVYTFEYADAHITRIASSDGFALTYTYNLAGDLINFTNAEGNVYTYTYNAQHHLLTVTDPTGKTYIDNVYDALGRVIQQGNAEGSQVFFDYAAGANTTVFHDALGVPLTHTYDSRQRLIREEDALGYAATSVYDDDNNLLSFTDKRGFTTLMTYDARGNLLSRTNALSQTWLYTYDNRNNRLSATDPLSHTTTYLYDAENHLRQMTDALGYTTVYTYNELGLVIAEQNPLGYVTRKAYNALGLPVVITDAVGGVTTYEYDARGNQIAMTDAAGRTARYLYNQADRLEIITDTLGYTTRFVYDANGMLVQEIDALGRSKFYGYDQNENLIHETDRAGQVFTSTYDVLNRRAAETNPLGYTTVYTYDGLGRLIARRDARGFVTTNTYDANGQLLTETDPRGSTTRYGYDALGQTLAVTDALGSVNRTAYDAVGNVLTETDALGNLTAYTYDALNHRLTRRNALGAVWRFTYDALGRVVQTEDPRGGLEHTLFDPLGRPLSEQDAAGGQTHRVYDAVGNLIGVTDRNGHTTTYLIDAMDRIVRETDALGGVVTRTYDALGNRLTQTDALGRSYTYTYDANRNLVLETDPLGGQAAHTYDALQREIAVTDANGHTTASTFDPMGNELTTVLPSGQMTTRAYDADGNPLSVMNPQGNVFTYTYDALNRRVQEVDPLGHTTTTVYDALGRAARVRDAQGRDTRNAYDAIGQLIGVTDALSQVTTYSYDALGNQTLLLDANGQATRYAYDALRRLITETDPLSRIITYTYDAEGNLLVKTDARGWATRHTYDALNRQISTQYRDWVFTPAAVLSPLASFSLSPTIGYTDTLFTADAAASTDPNTPTLPLDMRLDWDGDGLYDTPFTATLTATHRYPAPGVWLVYLEVRNSAGLTATATHSLTVLSQVPPLYRLHLPVIVRSGATFNTSAPTATPVPNRSGTRAIAPPTRAPRPTATPSAAEIQAARTASATGLRALATGTTTTTLAYTYDAVGNLVNMLDPHGLTVYTYDALNRLIRQQEPDGRAVAFTYDAVGNRLTTTYPTTGTVTNTYNANNWLVTVSDWGGTTVMTHTALGQVATLRYPNGASMAYTYDAAGRLVSVTNRAGDGVAFAAYSYTLDAMGNKISGTEVYSGAQGTITETYTYDPLYRLTASLSSDGTHNHYAFDAAGNRLTWAGLRLGAGGTEAFTITYGYDAANQLLSAADSAQGITTYAFDAAGNRTGEHSPTGEKQLLYDGLNHLRLASVLEGGHYKDGVQETYTYDGQNRRVLKTAWSAATNGGLTRQRDYLYDGRTWNTLAETEDGDTQLFSYRGGMQKLGVAEDGAVNYFHSDSLGSVVGYSNLSGNAGSEYARYADYGRLSAGQTSLLTDYAYTGHELDAYTQYHSAKMRFQDADAGVWLSIDPLRGNNRNPQTLNRYGYAHNNPINLIDLVGKCYSTYPGFPVNPDQMCSNVPATPVGGHTPTPVTVTPTWTPTSAAKQVKSTTKNTSNSGKQDKKYQPGKQVVATSNQSTLLDIDFSVAKLKLDLGFANESDDNGIEIEANNGMISIYAGNNSAKVGQDLKSGKLSAEVTSVHQQIINNNVASYTTVKTGIDAQNTIIAIEKGFKQDNVKSYYILSLEVNHQNTAKAGAGTALVGMVYFVGKTLMCIGTEGLACS